MPKIRITVEDEEGKTVNWDLFSYPTGKEAAEAFMELIDFLHKWQGYAVLPAPEKTTDVRKIQDQIIASTEVKIIKKPIDLTRQMEEQAAEDKPHGKP